LNHLALGHETTFGYGLSCLFLKKSHLDRRFALKDFVTNLQKPSTSFVQPPQKLFSGRSQSSQKTAHENERKRTKFNENQNEINLNFLLF